MSKIFIARVDSIDFLKCGQCISSQNLHAFSDFQEAYKMVLDRAENFRKHYGVMNQEYEEKAIYNEPKCGYPIGVGFTVKDKFRFIYYVEEIELD